MYNIFSEIWRISYGDLCFIKRHIPETVISALVGPLLYLLAFAYGMRSGDTEAGVDYVAYAIPGSIAISSMTSGYNATAQKILIQRLFHTSFDELVLCPMHTSSLIFGKTVIGVVRGLLGCIILLGLGMFLTDDLVISIWTIPIFLLSCVTFSLLGVTAGLLAKTGPTLTLFASVVILPMTFLCGTLFSIDALPDIVKQIIWALPLSHSSTAIRSFCLGWDVPWVSIGILLIYLVVFYLMDRYIILKKLY